MTNFSPLKPKRSAGEIPTRVYTAHLGVGIISVCERYDLYSREKEFFNRLSNPHRARKEHATNQREFMKQSNVYTFEFKSMTIIIEFRFDTSELMRAKIASKIETGELNRVGFYDQ